MNSCERVGTPDYTDADKRNTQFSVERVISGSDGRGDGDDDGNDDTDCNIDILHVASVTLPKMLAQRLEISRLLPRPRSTSAPPSVAALGQHQSSLPTELWPKHPSPESSLSSAESLGMASRLGLFPGVPSSTWTTSSARPQRGCTMHSDCLSASEDSSLTTNFISRPFVKARLDLSEATDESFDRPTSNNILRQLAEASGDSIICRRRLRVGPSHEEQKYSFDALEAEVDNLKEELSRMKEVEKRNIGSVVEEQSRNGDDSADSNSEADSPAARLQKQHEKSELDHHTGLVESDARALSYSETLRCSSDQVEFPALTIPTPAKTQSPGIDDLTHGARRRSSYAKVVGAGDNALTVAQTQNTALDMELVVPGVVVSGKCSIDNSEPVLRDEDEKAIQRSSVELGKVAFTATRGTNVTFKSNIPVPSGKTVKSSPHFAQPTQSFARRADATLRQHPTFSSPKSADTSPTKSARGKGQASPTANRATLRHQKRKSIPGAWINGTTGAQEAVEGSCTVDKPSMAASNIVPPVEEKAETIGSPNQNLAAAMNTEVHERATEPRRPQQTHSYMAPTSATIQRAAGTTAQIPSPSRRKPVSVLAWTYRANTNYAAIEECIGGPFPHDGNSAATSEASSVVFILDKSDAACNASSNNSTERRRGREKQKQTRATYHSPTKCSKHPEQILRAPVGQIRTQDARVQSSTSRAAIYERLISFGEVSNTTATRRTSHGSILQPIVQCLDRHRLLSQSPLRGNSLVQTYLQNLPTPEADMTIRAAQEEPYVVPKAHQLFSPRARKENKAMVATRTTSQHNNGRSASMHTSRSKSSQATLCDASIAPLLFTPTKRPATGRTTHQPQSLRPTAKEFTPRAWQQPEPQADAQEPRQLSWSDTLQYLNAEQWLSLPASVRHSIQILRGFKSATGWQPNGSSSPQPPSSQSPPGSQFWTRNLATGGSPLTPETISEGTGSPFTPNFIPTAYGRVEKSPGGGWTIGSIASRTPYRWAGGDGREIRFDGYGVHAEHNPNSPVKMDFRDLATPPTSEGNGLGAGYGASLGMICGGSGVRIPWSGARFEVGDKGDERFTVEPGPMPLEHFRECPNRDLF